MATRAKFRCLEETYYGNSQKKYKFSAVGSDGIPENERFTKYTPCGQLEMTVDNPNVSFHPGMSYYLDFTPATEA